MKTNDLRTELINALLSTENYRCFLREACAVLKRIDPSYSSAKFCRLAGIRAKSTLSDIIAGRRRITHQLLPKIAKGLKLDPDIEEAFRLLVYRTEHDLAPEDLQNHGVQWGVQWEMQWEKQCATLNIQAERFGSVFQNNAFPRIYAALGDERGATILEIAKRTEMPAPEIRVALNRMMELNIVLFNEDTKRYSTTTAVIFMPETAHLDQFRTYYISSLQRSLDRAQESFFDKDSIFLSTTMSVKGSNLAKLRQTLEDVVAKVVREFEEPLGDKVIELNLACTK